MKLKYVRTKEHGIVIFNPIINHSDMARTLKGTVESAGFIAVSADVDTHEPSLYSFGKSISLGIESKPLEDDKELERMCRL